MRRKASICLRPTPMPAHPEDIGRRGAALLRGFPFPGKEPMYRMSRLGAAGGGPGCGVGHNRVKVSGMSWQQYLTDFHASRPGITEAVLSRATHEGRTPYDWLLEAVPPGEPGPVLDLACGSAPLAPALRGHGYLGVDASAEELARARGAGPLVRADAAKLPLASGSFRTVLCSMGLQILAPLPDVLLETARVLAPEGRMVALLPDSGPLRGLDALWLTGLLAALGRRLHYPNDTLLRWQLPQLMHAAGLRTTEDRRRRFAYRLRSPADADVFLDSLYLPDLTARHLRAARRWLHAAARAHAALPVPVRRIVAVRTG